MIYYTRDGARIESDTDDGVVMGLRLISSGIKHLDLNQFMIEMSVRIKLQTGAAVRTVDAWSFIADLVKAGLLIRKG